MALSRRDLLAKSGLALAGVAASASGAGAQRPKRGDQHGGRLMAARLDR